MTILLYDTLELEERPSKDLNTWKAWHLILYSLAAVLGIVNFVMMQQTKELVGDQCILFPRALEFNMVELPVNNTEEIETRDAKTTENAQDIDNSVPRNETEGPKLQQDATTETEGTKAKREIIVNDGTDMTTEPNMTAIAANRTHRLMLDTSRLVAESENSCQFAEFMPVMATICAAVWLTMFTMCPSGGRARTGLRRPWRILPPALIFAVILVAVTGHSFTTTNKGIQDFCAQFYNVTNSTTCSSVGPYLPLGWNATWSFGSRVSLTRAAAGGAWAAWACVAALLLARCLAAPDFAVKRTAVYVAKDPLQKIIPHLKSKSPRSRGSSNSSPTKRDTASMRSEPTATTELVSAAVEPGPDSAPSSIMVTPAKTSTPRNHAIEMTYNPQENSLEPYDPKAYSVSEA